MKKIFTSFFLKATSITIAFIITFSLGLSTVFAENIERGFTTRVEEQTTFKIYHSYHKNGDGYVYFESSAELEDGTDRLVGFRYRDIYAAGLATISSKSYSEDKSSRSITGTYGVAVSIYEQTGGTQTHYY